MQLTAGCLQLKGMPLHWEGCRLAAQADALHTFCRLILEAPSQLALGSVYYCNIIQVQALYSPVHFLPVPKPRPSPVRHTHYLAFEGLKGVVSPHVAVASINGQCWFMHKQVPDSMLAAIMCRGV